MGILSSTYNILLIIVGFGALIFFHELGHFFAAKWAGIRTEAFAIGMGPVVCSWRKGIGLALGSSAKTCQQRMKKYLLREAEVKLKDGETELEISAEQRDRAEAALGIGETEYSLRWLPIGGFVKMLGQEDLKPEAVSEDPRSYNTCPIGKRMIVVSAGVIMNVLLAMVLFIWAFMVGVRFDAPVVGDVYDTMPAATTRADNADVLGIHTVGLEPGDVVTHIDGKPARTFADLHIASAMSRPGSQITLTVQRAGCPEPLLFAMTPRVDAATGLLSIGAVSGSSTTLIRKDSRQLRVIDLLDEIGLSPAGVTLGMQLVSAAGAPISTYEQFQARVAAGDGRPVPTVWQAVAEDGSSAGPPVEVPLDVVPQYPILRYPELAPDGMREFERGLFGLVPLPKITIVDEGSPNAEILRPGDVLLRAGSRDGIRFQQFSREIRRHAGQTLPITVLRDGKEQTVEAAVNRQGRLSVVLGYAWQTPIIAEPLSRVALPVSDEDGKEVVETANTPVASLNLLPRDRVESVNDTPVKDWASLREALRQHTAAQAGQGMGAEVELAVIHPTPGHERETLTLSLSAGQVADLHALTWQSELPSYAFQPIYTVLSAGGDPLTAIAMGFRETHKLIVMTYLTIDRLFRGSVGVEQLRGPVGIVDLGAKILPKGFMYFIFFLGMISVNLAVINFLPLPIVDGGLFLFLVYEKIRGRPPSIQFQNVATIVGICLIGGLLVVTFYNDIVRLLS